MRLTLVRQGSYGEFCKIFGDCADDAYEGRLHLLEVPQVDLSYQDFPVFVVTCNCQQVSTYRMTTVLDFTRPNSDCLEKTEGI